MAKDLQDKDCDDLVWTGMPFPVNMSGMEREKTNTSIQAHLDRLATVGGCPTGHVGKSLLLSAEERKAQVGCWILV